MKPENALNPLECLIQNLPCCVHAPHLFTEILQMAHLAKVIWKWAIINQYTYLKCAPSFKLYYVCVCSSISAYVYYMYISSKCIQKHAVLCQGCSSQISWRYSTLPLWKPIKVTCLAFFRHGLPKQLSSASFVAFNASLRNSSRLPQWRKATLRNLRQQWREAKGGATLRTPGSSTASLIPESHDGWNTSMVAFWDGIFFRGELLNFQGVDEPGASRGAKEELFWGSKCHCQ